MRVLLVSGLGPVHKNASYTAGTLFDQAARDVVSGAYFAARGAFSLRELGFQHRGTAFPLLRDRADTIPHLSTMTLEAILQGCDVDYECVDASTIWTEKTSGPAGHFDLGLLSTTFIWEMRTLRRAVRWFVDRFPGLRIVAGGQFTNLKYQQVLRDIPEVWAIVRGDGEESIPALVRAVAEDRPLSSVPNCVYRGTVRGEAAMAPSRNIDLDAHPSPSFRGKFAAVPFESMRGCPYSCKFCSFPAASPMWRYKSAAKIVRDWERYAVDNGAKVIKAMDSTFTVPVPRIKALLESLPAIGVAWEAYSRANFLRNGHIVEQLAASGCRTLSIGFESMSDENLRNMHKQVTAQQNRRALNLLRDSDVGYRCSFMVGYPGETPAEFEKTRDYLLDEFAGHFTLHIFGLSDETMPVWDERERFAIRILDAENPDYSWEHSGMDVHTAVALNHATLDRVRSKNDEAVLHLWQDNVQRFLVPGLSRKENLAIEKTVERIAMLPRDYPDPGRGLVVFDHLIASLSQRWRITRGDARMYATEPLVTD